MDQYLILYPNWPLLQIHHFKRIYTLLLHKAYPTSAIVNHCRSTYPNILTFVPDPDDPTWPKPINRVMQYIAILYNNKLLNYEVNEEGLHLWKAVKP